MYLEKRPEPGGRRRRRPARTSATRSCSPLPNCAWPRPASSGRCCCPISRAPTTSGARCATCSPNHRPWSAGPTVPSRATGTALRRVSPKPPPPASSPRRPAGRRAGASRPARRAFASTASPWSAPSSPSTRPRCPDHADWRVEVPHPTPAGNPTTPTATPPRPGAATPPALRAPAGRKPTPGRTWTGPSRRCCSSSPRPRAARPPHEGGAAFHARARRLSDVTYRMTVATTTLHQLTPDGADRPVWWVVGQ